MNNAIKRGWIAGIVAIVIVLLSFIATKLSDSLYISTLFSILFFIAMTFFILGFIEVGKKGEAKLLYIISIIFLIINIILFVLVLGVNIYAISTGNVSLAPAINDTSNLFDENSIESTMGFLGVFAGLIVAFLFIFMLIYFGCMTLFILSGVGMLKLKDKLSIAKATGIVKIIGAGLMITIIGAIVGVFVLFAAFIMEIIFLYQASKVFE